MVSLAYYCNILQLIDITLYMHVLVLAWGLWSSGTPHSPFEMLLLLQALQLPRDWTQPAADVDPPKLWE